MKNMDTLEIEIVKAADTLESNMKYFKEIGDPVIEYYTKDLDKMMVDVSNYIASANPQEYDINTLQTYFMQLTNLAYFVSANVERVGMLNDLSSMSYKDALNTNMIAYAEKDGKLPVAKLTSLAEKDSLTEGVLNMIYSRAYRILKAKVDSTEEMIKTLSKIISYKIMTIQNGIMNDDKYSVSTKQVLNEG